MKKPRVMVADDDRGVRSCLRRRLTAWNYCVTECADGLSAVDHASRGRFDVLILDHAMPNGDGRSIARMLRRETDTPIIFLSGSNREEFRDTVYALPDMYYLGKPLDADRLRELLSSLVGGRGTPIENPAPHGVQSEALSTTC